METATITGPAPGQGTVARLRGMGADRWARIGFLVLCAAALAMFVAFPTYPTYDSLYSLLWGRELVHGTALSFQAYRAPTEHPLAIVLSALLTPLGTAAAKVMLALAYASLIALAAALYRLGRVAFTPAVGLVAAGLLVTRWDFVNLSVRGYIDVPYLAVVFWAAALEAQRLARPAAQTVREGWDRQVLLVYALLIAAGLMRPEAWLLAGVYFLWTARRATWRERAAYAALTAAAPLAWAGLDAAVTGDPLFSLHSTSGLAEELDRDTGIGAIPSALPYYLIKTVKLPVAIAAFLGFCAAIWVAPRRAALPVVLLAAGAGTFVLVAFGGLSVIPRYLAVSQVMLVVFAAVAFAGWTMLVPGSAARRGWALVAAALVVAGIAYTAATGSTTRTTSDLHWREDSHNALVALLDKPAVRAAMRCGPVSVPNHKLVPDVRWLAHLSAERVRARTQPRYAPVVGSDGAVAYPAGIDRGLAIVIVNHPSLSRQVFVDGGGDPPAQLVDDRFERIATTSSYSAYARC